MGCRPQMVGQSSAQRCRVPCFALAKRAHPGHAAGTSKSETTNHRTQYYSARAHTSLKAPARAATSARL